MSITRLRLRRFQPHEDLVVELDPHATVLTGKSDAGKSAVLRSLRWLCTNQPSGDSFVKHGKKSACVFLTLDGHRIYRKKGVGVNIYVLDGSEYKAFGSNVPHDIAKLLNVGDVNWQLQHEPAFWLSLTPGECAKRLNEIVNLEAIDRSAAIAAQRVRQAKARVHVSKERLEQAEKTVSELGWVEKAYKDYQRADDLEQQLNRKREQIASIRSLLGDTSRLTEAIKSRQNAIVRKETLCGAAERLAAQSQRVCDLHDLYGSIIEQQATVEQRHTSVQELQQRLECETERCPLCGKAWKK